MRLPKDPLPTITPLTPAGKKPKPAELSPIIRGALSDYLKQNAAKYPLGGLGALGFKPQLTFGAPVSVTPYADLLPIFDVNGATEHISAAVEAANAPVMNLAQVTTLLDNAAAFAEQFPDPPAGVDVAFHIIGVLRTAPRLVTALKKSGPRKGTEIAGSIFRFVASLGVLLTDIPGLEHGKSAAESLAFVAKVGEHIFVIPASDIPVTNRR
jgi:hypothetical protein